VGEARRVLVIDDYSDSADSLAMLLELSGHDVKKAALGPQDPSRGRIDAQTSRQRRSKTQYQNQEKLTQRDRPE
jgi:CheY-like chemotaxis protein